jgi:ATP-dependent helicase/nuclease subunit A
MSALSDAASKSDPREALRPTAEALDAQRAASDPAVCVWVTANAGSGKTHVLAARVVRLLVDGVDPARILCLTYTKVAAANMRRRIFDTLARFATADDDALARALSETGVDLPRQAARPRLFSAARKLFAAALETPGGLKIQTIHAFCEMVLRRFPLEAGIAGHFELLEGRAQSVLEAEARAALILKATSGVVGGDRLAAAFDIVIRHAGEDGLDRLVAAVLALRVELSDAIPLMAGPRHDFAPLHRSLGHDAEETEKEIAMAGWPSPSLDDAGLKAMIDLAEAHGGGNFMRLAGRSARSALVLPGAVERFEALAAALLKGDSDVYGDNITSKAVRAADPGFLQRYQEAAAHVRDHVLRLRNLRLIRRSAAALTLAEALIADHERRKQARGLLDFNDLIARTRTLLERPDVSAWVRYKLDSGIDHILLDEAQDTSPAQWSVLRALTREIFENAAGANRRRSLFVVGDPKQSIYSFQGARPESFDDERRHHAALGRHSGIEVKEVAFNASFRSSPALLSGVDCVMAQDEVLSGMPGRRGTEHQSLRDLAPGRIDIWDLEIAEPAPPPEDWTARQSAETAPQVRLARRVARTIARWTRERFARAGDVLVLVRKRTGGFNHALARELKGLGVPVAGADRLNLLDHIAIRDLLALAAVARQPADDLSLAALLKSPVFHFGDDDLIRLAALAQGGPLLAALEADADPRSAAALRQIRSWRDRADAEPVDRFFALALGADGLRRRFAARFGGEVEEVLDAFLQVAADMAGRDHPGLDAFVETLTAAPPEIKRQFDQGRDEVRIMTVHAAKGLEARHVFLVDDGGGGRTMASQRAALARQPSAASPLTPDTCYVWMAGASKDPLAKEIIERDDHLAADEYRRLLYVAMTRAERSLTLCGWRSAKEAARRAKALAGNNTSAASPPFTGWHDWVDAALSPLGRTVSLPDGQTVKRYEPSGPWPADLMRESAPQSGTEPFSFPDLPEEPGLPRPLAPSAAALLIEAAEEDSAAGDDVQASPVDKPDTRQPSPVLDAVDGTAPVQLRGTLMHVLLQALPDMKPGTKPSRRIAAALAFLARAAPMLDEKEARRLATQALRLIDDPQFAFLFSHDGRAEAAICGVVTVRGVVRRITGKIDRIVDDGQTLWLVDFKTGAPPPDIASLPSAHVTQIALYCALAAPLFPGRTVRAALVYASHPILHIVPGATIEAALARLAAPAG